MIYFIEAGDGGPIKIGRAVDPESRLRQLQTGTPERLRLLAVVAGSRDLESDIHRRLAAHRRSGEWFEPAPDVFAVMAELRNPEYRTVDGRAYAVLRRADVQSRTTACPFCGERHLHGIGDGHRTPHCARVIHKVIRTADGVTLHQDHGYLVVTDVAEGDRDARGPRPTPGRPGARR